MKTGYSLLINNYWLQCVNVLFVVYKKFKNLTLHLTRYSLILYNSVYYLCISLQSNFELKRRNLCRFITIKVEYNKLQVCRSWPEKICMDNRFPIPISSYRELLTSSWSTKFFWREALGDKSKYRMK